MYEVLYIVACESKRDLEIREEIDRSRRKNGVATFTRTIHETDFAFARFQLASAPHCYY